MGLLREIAEKLGLTAERAWPYLVRQEYLQAMTSLIMALLVTAVLAVVCALLVREGENDADWYGAACLVGVFAIIAACVAASFLPAALNPEGAAILRLLGK